MSRVSIGRAELETRPHILYRFYDRTGVLLYIGITVDFADRMATHAKEKEWWARVDRSATKVEYFDGRRAALEAERDAIKAEHPLENDQHNEWVEDDESSDALWEFACDLLSWLPDRQREEILADSSTDWDERPLSVRDTDIAAARQVVPFFSRKLRRCAELLGDYLDLLPGDDGTTHRERAAQEFFETTADERYPDYPQAELIDLVLASLAKAEAGRVLSEIPEDEALEWMSAAKSLGLRDEDAPVIFGARRANLFKNGRIFVRLCNGPGKHGARCANKAEFRTFFEVCRECRNANRDACHGHTHWCAAHAMEATNGGLTLLETNPAALQPILRSEPVAPDADEVPF
jgi:predicted GIY-YIG superfamily endonuclease